MSPVMSFDISKRGATRGQATRSAEPGDAGGNATLGSTDHERALHDRLDRIERLLSPRHLADHVEQGLDACLPAWRRVTRGEHRAVATATILVAIGLMTALPPRVANRPRWMLPAVALLLLVALVIANPARLERQSRLLRAASIALIAVLSIANAASAARLVVDLVNSQGIRDPGQLLLTGGAIWLTNVVVFSLWYWESDRGGPVQRSLGTHEHPDFLFTQMSSSEFAPAHWEPKFIDYLYLSYTNATAFSPTDVMPMSRWAKLVMLLQSAVSIVTIALVVARAVNVLR